MIIPIDRLVNEKRNMYAMTNAIIRRAYQLTVTGDESVERDNSKIVSVAIGQILTQTVQYQIEE